MTAAREASLAKTLAMRRHDVRSLMQEPEFRRLAYWLVFELAPADGATFNAGNTHLSAYLEGRRSIAIELGRLLRSEHLVAFQQMEREAIGARRVAYGVHGDSDSSD